MNMPDRWTLLRKALIADALISGVTGTMMMIGAPLVDQLLGLPSSLLLYAGLSLLPFAALLAVCAIRPSLPQPLVWAIIAYNALWAIDSVLLLLLGVVSPTLLGTAFVIAQAVVVALLAELQYMGLRAEAGARA